MKPSGFRPAQGAAHDAALYQSYRPLYPPDVFQKWMKTLQKEGKSHVLELGCGAGQALSSAQRSLPRPGLHWTGVDPNADMLAYAAEAAARSATVFKGHCAPAEDIDAWKGSYDAAVFASSLHWIDPMIVGPILRERLRPKAPILWTEYQFPKVQLEDPAQSQALNDWIRDNFRSRWKFEGQRSRGRFRDLVKTWLVALTGAPPANPAQAYLPIVAYHWEEVVERDGFIGLLLSQARVQAALQHDPNEQDWIIDALEKQLPSMFSIHFPGEYLSLILP